MFHRIAIHGVGLLGGSLGMACRQRHLAAEVIGVGRNAQRLARAQALGAVDRFTTDAREGFAQADFIVLAAPVQTILDILPLVRDVAPAGALVTDVGSAKSSIMGAAETVFAGSRVHFIGSHPMAGSERTGVENARADLYRGAPVYLTPQPADSNRWDGLPGKANSQPQADDNLSMPGSPPTDAAIERLIRFWTALGAHVTVMPARRHDRLVAFLSHLPHAAAVAVITALKSSGLDESAMRALAGPGLLDTTRVAAGSTEMWRDIFLENREPVLEALDGFLRECAVLRDAIAQGETKRIEAILDAARALRQSLGAPKANGE